LQEDPLAERCLKIVNLLASPRSHGPQSSFLTPAFDSALLSEMLQSNPAWSGSGLDGDDLAQAL
jgi:hypothetical protein